jgi:lipopolysaccharide heptosyltransferase II
LNLDKTKIKKVLIIKPGAIGDVVLSTPVIENLRHNLPHAEINFLTQKYCRDAVIGNPFLNRVLTYDLSTDSGKWLVKNIRQQKYDMVIDLFCNPRTALITFRSRAKYRVGFKFRFRSYAYNILKIPRSNEVHNIDFNLDALRAIGFELITNKPQFYINILHKEFADKYFTEYGLSEKDVIGINPGGTWDTKVWYKENFAELIKKLKDKYKILLFWGNEKEKILAQEINRLSCEENIYIIPEVGIKYMAALIRKCRLFIANDTGPMHISCAMGANTATIFGPTKSRLHGHPSDNSIIIENENLNCLGCDLTKIADCQNEHKCMRDLNPDIVYTKVMKLLESTL